MPSSTHFRALLWLAIALRELHAFPFPFPFFAPYTSQQDVYAVNDLYTCLGSPALDGWTATGGDPCKDAWQGVQCFGPNITVIELKGANLGGKLSETMGNFTSVTRLDLSNNHIAGSIPHRLPPAIRELDLSSNNLSGHLPDSMEKLASLSKLHVQNNQLTGTLDALGDLPLKDLNVEHNLFSGHIPEKLLSIPNFQRDGNNFSIPVPYYPPVATTPPVPSLLPPPRSPNYAPAPRGPQAVPNLNPPVTVIPQDARHEDPTEHKNKIPPAKAVGYSVLAASSLIVATVLVVFSVSTWKYWRGSFHGRYLMGVDMSIPQWMKEKDTVAKSDREPGAEEKIERHGERSGCAKTMVSSVHPIFKNSSMDEDDTSDTKFQGAVQSRSSPFSFVFFTVASLQQCTDSFSDRNLMRETGFGKVYLAEENPSKFSVLKLDDKNAKMPGDDFLRLVQSISELRHPNIDELIGCCAEHGQRLLIYKHFSDSTLDDMIHFNDDNDRKKLPWHARISVALEAAKTLEYLHEGCQERVVHQHFSPENVLVDGELRVRVAGCGVAPFVSLGLGPQLSDCCDRLSYEPPEVGQSPSATWTEKGDIFSFGVVMLQLLTGRRPYDSSRPRGERHLVRWASSRLHDLDALRGIAEPRLAGVLPVRSLSRFADIISRCIQQEPEFRPAMSQVVQDLRRALEEAANSCTKEMQVGI